MSDPSKRMLVSFLTGLCVIAANDQRPVHAQHNRSIGPSPTSNLRVPKEDPLVGKCYARPVNRVYVPQVGGQFGVAVARGKFAYVYFPEWVTLDNIIFEHRGFNIDAVGRELSVSPGVDMTVGDVANVVIKAGDLRLSMEVRVTEPADPASIVDVIPLPNEDFERRKIEEQARIAQTERERNASIMRHYRRSMARTLLGMEEEVRPTGPRLAGLGMPAETRYAPPEEARAVLTRILQVDGYRYLEVILENRASNNVRMEAAYISEGAEAAVPADVVLQLPYGQPDKARSGLPAVAPADTRVRGMVVIPDNIHAGLGGLHVYFQGPQGMPGLVATEVIELWPRMPEHIQRRRRWAKQIAISARVLGGGYWMGIGDDTAGTTMTGLSVRLTKGLSSLFAFEGELGGGRSGAAHFSDITWRGMTGDATRQASFGRLHGAGVIRFGEHYLTSMRLGVGLQVTNYDSTMVTGGASVDGPGDGFEVDGFFAAGLGFDARLGEHWLFGAGATFAAGFKTEIRSLEVGIHAGYRWSLEGEDGSLIER